MVKKQYSKKSKKVKKKQVLLKTVIADTKVCSDCKASFIPDDEEKTCAECLNKQKGGNNQDGNFRRFR